MFKNPLRRSSRFARQLFSLTGMLGCLASPAGAQGRGYAVELDNDIFDFTVPLSALKDREYTHGVRFSYQSRERFLQSLPFSAPACNSEIPADSTCQQSLFSFGQKIYTPRLRGSTEGERPFAGWLYVSAAALEHDARRQRSLRATLGVTGKPSLGEISHTLVHELGGWPIPRGWSEQIGFEPGLILEYEEKRLWEVQSQGGVPLLYVIPSGTLSAGNVHTGARAQVEARIGWRVPHPWMTEPGRDGASLYATGRARKSYVARNLFLDGNTGGDTAPVEKNAWNFSHSVGVGASWQRVQLEYLRTAVGAEYRTIPAPHSYGSFILSYFPALPDSE